MSSSPSDDGASDDQTDEQQADTSDGEPRIEQSDLGEGLAEIQAAVAREFTKIETDGERIKKVVGKALLNPTCDRDVAQDLQQELINLLSEHHSEQEVVTVDEIAVALWAELDRVSRMATNDTGTRERTPTTNGGGGSEETPSPSSSRRPAPTADESADQPRDPTFH